MKNYLQGKKVIVIGAARQGLAATRYLAAKQANVILTDSRPLSDFKGLKEQFTGQSVEFNFGSHSLDILDHADMLCISGGVPLSIALIQEAQKRGILLTNDSQLFMKEVSAKVIGITGSAGKTTTTVLTGAIAKAAVEPGAKVWVGGNIGYPMIDDIDEIKPEDWVVHEFSSFQLEQMTISPHIAVVTNITPNHLDRHKTMQAYTAAKAHILKFQTRLDFAVLNRDDYGAYGLQKNVIGNLLTFGFEKPSGSNMGIFIENGYICRKDGKEVYELFATSEVKLAGNHNKANAMAACAASLAAGFSVEAMRKGIASIEGIPHRLELIRVINGVSWYNDSIATTPERVMAALRAISGQLVILLGGRDKDLPWVELVGMLHVRRPKVILFGEAAPLIGRVIISVEGCSPAYPVFKTQTLGDAIKKASEIATAGEAVLLSPGGTSYDAYRDFEERGDEFRNLVKDLT